MDKESWRFGRICEKWATDGNFPPTQLFVEAKNNNKHTRAPWPRRFIQFQ